MSQADPTPFADRLMKSEPIDDALRERYEAEKQRLSERRLTPSQKWMAWLALPVNAWLIGSTLKRIWANPDRLPSEWLVLDCVSAAFLLIFGIWILAALLRGGLIRWQADQAIMWISMIGTCTLALAFYGIGESLDDLVAATRFKDFAVVFLLGGRSTSWSSACVGPSWKHGSNCSNSSCGWLNWAGPPPPPLIHRPRAMRHPNGTGRDNARCIIASVPSSTPSSAHLLN